jgi:hypothetical protein
MNYTQLTAYLQAYLQTNDAQVIDNIPNFLSIAAARMATDIRNSLIEQQVWLDAIQAQPLPLGFVAVRLMTSNGVPLDWITPKQYAEGGQGFTIQAQQILISPIPETTDSIQLTYYVINLNNALANNIPHILLHCAAAEAEMFQGDLEAAVSEMQLYKGDTDSSNGWDFQGSISLGGLSATSEAVSASSSSGSGSNAQPRAGNVSFEPAGTLQSTNVQAALQELDSDQVAHSFNTANPHLTTAVQVGAVPMVSANVVGNVLTADGTYWISAAPTGSGGGATWGTITGSLNSQSDLVAEFALHTTDTEFNAHLTGAAAHTAANVGAIPMVSPGSAGNVLTSQGGAWVSATPSSPKIARSGVQVLSAANHDFTLPVGCTSFALPFSDLSTNGTVAPRLQMLTGSAVPTTSGYAGCTVGMTSATVITPYTNGLGLQSGTVAAANIMNGTINGELINAANNLWQLTFQGCRTDNDQGFVASSRVQLAAAATGVRLTINGTNLFDGGSAACTTIVP